MSVITVARLGYVLVPAVLAYIAKRWRAMHDYFDFVAACQFNTDDGTVGNVHSCIVLNGKEGSTGKYELASFKQIIGRFRAAYIGDAGEPVKPSFRRLCSTAHGSPVFWPYWSTPPTVPNLDADYHFVNHGVAKSFDDIEAFVTTSLSTGLDTSRPLWQAHYWERVGGEGADKSVFLLKVHHCVADGFSTLRTVLTACERLDGRSISDGNSPPSAGSGEEGKRKKIEAKRKAGVQKLTVVGKALATAAAAKKMLLLPQDPVSALKAATHLEGPDPRVAGANWPSDQNSISVAWLKEIGRATPSQATVNDLLLTAMSGAFRRHIQAKHDAAAAAAASGKPDPSAGAISTVQAVVWVALQPFRDLFKPPSKALPLTWGNAGLGAVYLQLPIDQADREARLTQTISRVRALTASPEPLLGNALIAMFGALPRLITRPIWKAVAFKTTLSMSNMPGPQFPLAFLESPIDQIFFFVAPLGTIGLFLTIFSFDGRVTVSLSADARLLDREEAKKVTGPYFRAELQALHDLYCGGGGGGGGGGKGE